MTSETMKIKLKVCLKIIGACWKREYQMTKMANWKSEHNWFVRVVGWEIPITDLDLQQNSQYRIPDAEGSETEETKIS